MKNLLYGTLFLVLVGIIFVGCEKEKFNFTQEFNSNYESNINYSSIKKVHDVLAQSDDAFTIYLVRHSLEHFLHELV